jgi:putative tricarboxylic transport membrane protein
MGNFQDIISALGQVLTLSTIMWIPFGVVVGVIFGAAPGQTATTAVALFTPMTFYLPLNASLSLLLGIYCGGFYAGSIPAILIKTPGAPGNAATTLDGHPMASKGKAGEALTHSVFSSWLGGTIGAIALLIFAPMLGRVALRFGAPEYFSVGMLGLACVAGISGKSMLKGIVSVTIGLVLATIGMDPIVGNFRFTFGNTYLLGGIALIPALVGLFAITEVISKVNFFGSDDGTIISNIKMSWPDLKFYWKSKVLILKSSAIGVFIGAVPGIGPTIASWMSYNEAKRTSKYPEKFGTGVAEGIMSSEASNNAVTGGALIPLLTLGVPGDTVTAVLLSALMIQGLVPGPTLVVNNYGLVATILWTLIFANIIMLMVGLLGSRFFPYVLRTRWQIMLPVIAVLCVTGGYASNNSFFDVKMLMIIGAVGFFFQQFDYPVAPMVLGLILGPIIEPNFRRALMGSDWTIFFTRPFSLGILILTVATVAFMKLKMSKVQ